MADCLDCKPNILNKQDSIIAIPTCDECGTLEVQCDGEYIYTDCVKSNVALDCINTAVGATQTVVNQAIVAKLCNIDQSCTASISVNDNCCGYLEDKIVSDSLDITTESTSGCEVLRIEEKCWTWNSVLDNGSSDGRFKSKWENYSANGGTDYQDAQYSDVKECIVKLRGTVYNSGWQPSELTLFTLPVGFRPSKNRRFSVNVTFCNDIKPGYIIISTNGDVTAYFNNSCSSSLTTILSLDSISFEIEP